MLRLPLLIVSLLVSTLLWSQVKTAAQYYTEGKALLEKDQHKEAMVAFQNAVAKDPKHAQSLYEVGWLYNELEKYEDALIFLNRAAKADPKDNRANFEIAYAYNNLGKTKQAISFYRKVLKLDADYGDAMFELGLIYKDQAKLDSALYFFEAYTDLAPDDMNNEVYYQIGWIQSEQGNYKEALENLDNYDPVEDADIATKYTEMGFAYYKLKDSTNAIDSYMSALEADEDHVTALIGLGDVHFGLTENYEKAVPFYTRAIQTDEKKAKD
jgi:tetratricopeptide (TPR) repeat protein